MTDTPKRLGAVVVTTIPTTGVNSSGWNLYTVPAATYAIVSTVFACNRNTNNNTANIRIAQVDAGTINNLAPEDYLYDLYLSAHDTFASTCGISMGPLDTLVVYSDQVGVNFIASGLEIT